MVGAGILFNLVTAFDHNSNVPAELASAFSLLNNTPKKLALDCAALLQAFHA